VLSRSPGFVRRPGRLAGVFMAGYAISRLAVELVREPDTQLGFLFAGVTMGQLLSLPMLVLGLALVFLAPKSIERQAEAQA
jgi:phosphatidylglycerol:prolipoprotein diacylglycerol transferase